MIAKVKGLLLKKCMNEGIIGERLVWALWKLLVCIVDVAHTIEEKRMCLGDIRNRENWEEEVEDTDEK